MPRLDQSQMVSFKARLHEELRTYQGQVAPLVDYVAHLVNVNKEPVDALRITCQNNIVAFLNENTADFVEYLLAELRELTNGTMGLDDQPFYGHLIKAEEQWGQFVRYLVNEGAREEKHGGGGVSMKECFHLLAKKGFDLNEWTDEDGEPPLSRIEPLHSAEVLEVDGGALSMRECLEILTTNGYNVNNWMDGEGDSPLQACVEEGALTMVEVLVDMNADVNYISEAGKVPILSAATRGHEEIASLLLKHGAKTHPNIFAIHQASFWAHAGVVTALLKAGADALEEQEKLTPASYCVIVSPQLIGKIDARFDTGKAEALSTILRAGGDANNFDKGYYCLLHYAAINNLPGCVSVLVNRGVDPNAPSSNTSKDTPLHMACYSGSADAVRQLAKLGANLEALDADGYCPLLTAVVCAHDGCVEALIECGATVTTTNKHGFTPLHYASAAGRAKSAYLLIEGGATTDALSNGGYSPLMVCMKPDLLPGLMTRLHQTPSKERRSKVMRLLVEMGAEVSDKVMKYAVQGAMSDVLADTLNESKEWSMGIMAKVPTMCTTLLEQGEDVVVHVRLQDKATGEKDARLYKLNTELVQYLSRRAEGGEDHSVPLAPLAAGTAPSSVLLTLLDPSSRGFKGDDDGDIAASTSGDTKEVVLKCDGYDFTKEGFGLVIAYLTTGRVDHLLVDKARRAGTDENGIGGTVSRHGEEKGSRKRKRSSEGEGDGTGEGNAPKPWRRPLFDGEMAAKALQAADYFCLEGMMEEVKRLMDIYGFEYEDAGAIVCQ